MSTPADATQVDPSKAIWIEWQDLKPGMKFRVGYWSPEKQQMIYGDEWLFLQSEPVLTLERLTLTVYKSVTTKPFELDVLFRHNPRFLIATG